LGKPHFSTNAPPFHILLQSTATAIRPGPHAVPESPALSREGKVDLQPGSPDKINLLIRKGADIPNPLTLDIGEEVRVGQISPERVKICPGCRT